MIASEPLPEAELWRRSTRGDTAAFATIVERHQDGLVNYLTRLTGNPDRAEDLAQDAFLRLYSRAHGYREEGKLGAYLYSIATNLLRSQQRREMRWKLLHPLLVRQEERSGAPPQHRELLSRESDRRVQAAISELPLRYRVPLVLHEIEGWPYGRIAEVLSCREGTVKSRIYRARQRLKKRLESFWNGGSPE